MRYVKKRVTKIIKPVKSGPPDFFGLPKRLAAENPGPGLKRKTITFKRRSRICAALLCAALLSCLFSGCAEQEYISRDGFYFDTFIRISIYSAPDREAALDTAFELCAKYDALFGRETSGSDIARVNGAGGQPVKVERDTFELIEKALGFCELSGGAFDITCGRLTALWDFDAETPSLPGAEELEAALRTVDYTAVRLDADALTVAVPDGTYIDVGAVAKGFIADKISERLREDGCTGAVINLGGNVYALGSKRGKPFSIGIQSPFDPDGYLETVSVKDSSVVTAGSYQRCFTLDGKRYHHILDLSDGMPAETGIASVTMISESSADGDALATVCFLLGESGAAELLRERFPGCEAYIILDSGEIVHI